MPQFSCRPPPVKCSYLHSLARCRGLINCAAGSRCTCALRHILCARLCRRRTSPAGKPRECGRHHERNSTPCWAAPSRGKRPTGQPLSRIHHLAFHHEEPDCFHPSLAQCTAHTLASRSASYHEQWTYKHSSLHCTPEVWCLQHSLSNLAAWSVCRSVCSSVLSYLPLPFAHRWIDAPAGSLLDCTPMLLQPSTICCFCRMW